MTTQPPLSVPALVGSGVDDNLDWAGMYRQVANERDRLAGELLKRRLLSDGTEPRVGQRVIIVHDIAVRWGLTHADDGLVHEITSLLGGDSHLVECGPRQIGVGMLRLADSEVTCKACLGWRMQMAKMQADAEAFRRTKEAQAECQRLRKLLGEACEIAEDLNDHPNDGWRGSIERRDLDLRLMDIREQGGVK